MYYFCEKSDGAGWIYNGVFHYDDSYMRNVTSKNSRIPTYLHDINSSELEIVDNIFRYQFLTDDFRFTPTPLLPGQFYRRIARPYCNLMESQPTNPERFALKDQIMQSQNYLRSLISIFEKIALVIEPNSNNMECFGYELRNLLILACTESEAQWRMILINNGFVKTRYNTNDFVLASAPLKLAEYSFAFSHWPSAGEFTPFEHWRTSGNPTQDLPWYEAYNATKHNRIDEFHRATFRNAACSLGACWIMSVAQFGGPVMGDLPEIRDYFKITKRPKWSLSDCYIGGVNDLHHRPREFVNFPFDR